MYIIPYVVQAEDIKLNIGRAWVREWERITCLRLLLYGGGWTLAKAGNYKRAALPKPFCASIKVLKCKSIVVLCVLNLSDFGCGSRGLQCFAKLGSYNIYSFVGWEA